MPMTEAPSAMADIGSMLRLMKRVQRDNGDDGRTAEVNCAKP